MELTIAAVLFNLMWMNQCWLTHALRLRCRAPRFVTMCRRARVISVILEPAIMSLLECGVPLVSLGVVRLNWAGFHQGPAHTRAGGTFGSQGPVPQPVGGVTADLMPGRHGSVNQHECVTSWQWQDPKVTNNNGAMGVIDQSRTRKNVPNTPWSVASHVA